MSEPFALPSYAYVPGVSKRHPEGHFDHIRSSVDVGMTPKALARSDAFQCGLHFLEAEFYWEAHEVLEPVWLALPKEGDERKLVQALIQFANAKLKVKMRRPKAAKRLCDIVRGLLADIGTEVVMGLEVSLILHLVDSFEQANTCAK